MPSPGTNFAIRKDQEPRRGQLDGVSPERAFSGDIFDGSVDDSVEDDSFESSRKTEVPLSLPR